MNLFFCFLSVSTHIICNISACIMHTRNSIKVMKYRLIYKNTNKNIGKLSLCHFYRYKSTEFSRVGLFFINFKRSQFAVFNNRLVISIKQKFKLLSIHRDMDYVYPQ